MVMMSVPAKEIARRLSHIRLSFGFIFDLQFNFVRLTMGL
jgi:hypothetical protein